MTPALSRREFLQRSALVAGAGVIAPFSFVRDARATDDQALQRYLRRQVDIVKTPGIAAAVVRGDRVVWSAGAGWADIERGIRTSPDTVFQLASVSKTVTCAGIMTLVEDGVLDLDADINRYIPFEVHVPAAPDVPITVRTLLTHTSAIRDRWQIWGTPTSDPTLYFHGDSPIPLGAFCRSYFSVDGSEYRPLQNFFQREPGTVYTYSNLAVALAGYVAESASGTDFDALCKERILAPLGMSDSGYRLVDIHTTDLAMPYSDKGAFRPIYQYGYPDYPDGALRTSAVHLARWLGAFMNGGSFQGDRVLDESTVREIRRNQIPDVVSWRQGLIWFQERTWGFPMLGHDGGDFGETTRMFFRPDRNVGVVTLTNAYLDARKWPAFTDIERHLFAVFS